jgi:hypothetical protein
MIMELWGRNFENCVYKGLRGLGEIVRDDLENLLHLYNLFEEKESGRG